MDSYDRIQNEIIRQRKLIEDCESIMDQVPSHMREYQEIVLNIHKETLEKLENNLKNEEVKEKPLNEEPEKQLPVAEVENILANEVVENKFPNKENVRHTIGKKYEYIRK